VIGANFQEPLSVEVFYGDNRIATLSSSDSAQTGGLGSDAIFLNFDFQGKPGPYGVEVTSAGTGRSARFSFTIVAP
jgi:hypothetical protein